MERGEEYYKNVVIQMQHDNSRVVTALQKQVDCLLAQNKLLKQTTDKLRVELRESKFGLQHCGHEKKQLQEQLNMMQEDLYSYKNHVYEEMNTHVNECSALKSLLQQEDRAWREELEFKRKEHNNEMEELRAQMDVAKHLASKEKELNRTLGSEIQALTKRLQKAIHRSEKFEKRVDALAERAQKKIQEKDQENEVLVQKLHQRDLEIWQLERKTTRLRSKVKSTYPATTSTSSSPVSSVTASTLDSCISSSASRNDWGRSRHASNNILPTSTYPHSSLVESHQYDSNLSQQQRRPSKKMEEEIYSLRSRLGAIGNDGYTKDTRENRR